MQKLLLLLCFLFLNCALKAQEANSCTQKYEWPGGYQEELPDFLFAPQQETEAIGVSDPGLRPEIAKEQAIQRALLLHSLKRGSQLNTLTDYFTINQPATNTCDYEYAKLMSISRLQPPRRPLTFSIIHEHTSAYGEVFVQLSITKAGKEKRVITAMCELMSSVNHESHELQEEKLILSIQSEDSTEINNQNFTLKGNKDKLYITSILNDAPVSFKTGQFRYKSCGEGTSDKKGSLLSDAFWGALTESLINDVISFQAPKASIRSINENYMNQSHQMTREMINEYVTLYPVISAVAENRLIINWTIKSIQ